MAKMSNETVQYLSKKKTVDTKKTQILRSSLLTWKNICNKILREQKIDWKVPS